MKINIHDIRDSKAGEIRDNQTLDPVGLDLPLDLGITWHPLRFDYVLTNATNIFLLRGKLKADISLECSRCLKPIDYQLIVDVSQQFGRLQASEQDEDVHQFSGEEIDATEVLRESVLLDLPVKPLCSPDCRGLCPQCGIDKNQDSCDCDPVSVDPRLAVLEKLIRK